MKALKYIVIGLVVLVAVVLVGGYIAITTVDIESYRGEIQAEAEKATGRQLRLSGDMELKPSFSPSIVVNDVGFANAAWGSREEMATLQRFELALDLLPLLSGEVKVNRLILIEPDILLETNAEGRGNWELEAMAGEAEEEAEEAAEMVEEGEPLAASIGSLEIQGGRLTYKDGQTGQTLNVALDEMILKAPSTTASVELAARGSYQDLPFDVSGTLSSIKELTDPEASKSYDIAGTLGEADLKFTGTMTPTGPIPQIDSDFALTAPELTQLAAAAGIELPPLKDLDVKGAVLSDGETVTISNLDASIGASDVSGEIKIFLTGDRPMADINLTSSLLDLSDFGIKASEGEAAESAPADDDSPYVIPETALPLDALKGGDAQVRAEVGTLRMPDGMEITEVSITMLLDKGNLALKPLKATAYDGRMETTLGLDASQATPTMALNLTVDGFDYGKYLESQDMGGQAEGTVDISMAVTGQGASPRAIASSLDGNLEVVGGKGVITNRLMRIVSGGLSEIMKPLFEGADDNTLHCAYAGYDIAGGVAETKGFIIDSNVFTLSGTGNVDLRTEELNLYFDTSTREASIASLAIPFRVLGTMKNPEVVPDPTGAALSAAQSAGFGMLPVEGVGAFVGQSTSGGEQTQSADNPCVGAVEEAASGGGFFEQFGSGGLENIQDSLGGATDGGADGVTEGVKDVLEGGAEGADDAVKSIEEGVKGLLGN